MSTWYSSIAMLVSWCCLINYHKLSDLTQQKLIFSQSWRLEDWNLLVFRAIGLEIVSASSPLVMSPSTTVWFLVPPLNGNTWLKSSLKSLMPCLLIFSLMPNHHFSVFTLLFLQWQTISSPALFLKHFLSSVLGLPSSALLFPSLWFPLLVSAPLYEASPMAQWVKNPPAVLKSQETRVWSLGQEDPLK